MATNGNSKQREGKQLTQGATQDIEWIEASRKGDQNATAELISAYSGMIHSIVVQQSNTYSNDEYPDIFNEGVVAFLRAVELYDANKGASFATYAYMWTQQAVKRYMSKFSGHMKLSPDKYRLMAKVLRLSSEGMTHEEVAQELNITMKTLNSVLRAKLPMTTLEGQAEETQALIDTLASEMDVERDVSNKLLNEALYRWIDQLDKDEQKLLSLRYGLNGNHNHTFEEIATIMTAANSEAKPIKKGKAMTLCDKAEEKLIKIAQRESSLSSTSMFAQSNNSGLKPDSNMGYTNEPMNG